MESFRNELFGRKTPLIEECFINHPTDIYSNFQGRLPNTKPRTFDKPLPAKALVKVLKQEGDFTLVTVIKSPDEGTKGTGWVQSASLDLSHQHGTKGGRKMKGPVVNRGKTLFPQTFFKRGEATPTPKLRDQPFEIGTRVRIQEFRGEWTLVVLLDRVGGRGGLEGWVPTEFVSRKDE